ncbi:MAG: GNAT family N-acetyltransferase [Rhodospirillaceae bacterium]|nr:MAG: GNAT family N-acetyltransferase [Rhodospirillaceae bacterium]
MKFTVLGVGDALSMAQLHTEGFGRPWSESDFAILLANETSIAFGLKESSKLRAFILLRNISPELEIFSLVVSRKFRRQGLARCLVSKSLASLAEAQTCFLEVSQSNKAALSLYRSLGFKDIGIRHNYYQSKTGVFDHAILMKFQL